MEASMLSSNRNLEHSISGHTTLGGIQSFPPVSARMPAVRASHSRLTSSRHTISRPLEGRKQHPAIFVAASENGSASAEPSDGVDADDSGISGEGLGSGGSGNGVPQGSARSVSWSSRRTKKREGTATYERPKRIILVRHGESEGNVDEAAYTRIPDSRIALTKKGWDQAKSCGQQMRELIESDGEEDWKVYFYVSPYRRTIQTLRGIGLAFERDRIAGVREEPRIREQDFGNFQCRERMRVEKQVRLRYGRFFYRFPDGESAADVYDRVTGFRETLRADIEIGRFQRANYSSPNMNLVLVSHGLTLRVFLMRWFKWTVRHFEGLYNLNNASMIVMEKGEGGRYSLRLHHSREELRRFGMTEEMIDDQEWQVNARPGDLNHNWITSGPSFFDHFDDNDEIIHEYVCEGLSEGCIPEEILAMGEINAN